MDALLTTDDGLMRVYVALDGVLIHEMGPVAPEKCPTQLVIIVKVKHQASVLESSFTGVISEVKVTGMETSFKQLAA